MGRVPINRGGGLVKITPYLHASSIHVAIKSAGCVSGLVRTPLTFPILYVLLVFMLLVWCVVVSALFYSSKRSLQPKRARDKGAHAVLLRALRLCCCEPSEPSPRSVGFATQRMSPPLLAFTGDPRLNSKLELINLLVAQIYML